MTPASPAAVNGRPRRPVRVANWSALGQRQPAPALVANVDLVVVRDGEAVHVLYGRCLHRGALLADGQVRGPDLVCGLHGWDYRLATGISAYNPADVLPRFEAWVDEAADAVFVDANEVAAWEQLNPQRYRRDEYLGEYADFHGTAAEAHNAHIQHLARHGLSRWGHHGPISAMGVESDRLPDWDDLQILTAQLATQPLLDEDPVDTQLVIGPGADKPLVLAGPLLVSDMSFGALSREAKIALAMGAESAGTAICSGEGGMLPEEKAASSRYLYELASGRFGWSLDKAATAQALHFKVGQGAKTGTGGHLPARKVTPEIAAVRGLTAGEAAVSPARFPDLTSPADFRRVADEVRTAAGGIPIGFKMSAQHVEADIDFALEVGVDYIILDGRGGGTAAAPDLFKNHISVPTMAAVPRARRHLDQAGARGVTLIATGGLRTETDFVKVMALGADGVAIANSALQAIGCLGMRACHTNNCPVGIATQREELRARLVVEESARRLTSYLEASVELMAVLARACGHDALSGLRASDLTSWKPEVAALAGVAFAGPASRSAPATDPGPRAS